MRFMQDADHLDFASLLTKVTEEHAKGLLKVFQMILQRGPTRSVFSPPGEVTLKEEGWWHCTAFF